MKVLGEIAYYVSDKVDCANLKPETYISTENMLPNRGGVVGCVNSPNVGRVTQYDINDILVSNIRPYFKKIWFANQKSGCSNDVLVFRAYDDSVCPKFLYYVLSQDTFFDHMMAGANGTKMPRGNKKEIMSFLVPDFDISVQRRIADILSAYDDLIENNQKQIKLLEEAAQRLYKEWFVDFRFPGHESTPIINGIPQGWKIRKLASFGKIVTGKTPSTVNESYYGGDIPFVKIPDMHGVVFPLTTESKLSVEGAMTQPNKFIPPNSIMVSCIATVGLVNITAQECQTNQQINSIILNDNVDLYYLYFFAKRLEMILDGVGSNGATMTNVNKTKFANIDILYPTVELCDKFYSFCKPIFEDIFSLSKKFVNLSEARDRLLPKLMSGELEVE